MPYKAIKHASKYHKHVSKSAKKFLLIGAAVVGAFALLVIVLLIALIIWIFSMINQEDVTNTVNQAQEIGQQVTSGFNIQDYLQNGVINTEALQQQVDSLTPQEVTNIQNQVNEQLQAGQMTLQQANDIRALLGGN